MRKLSLLIVHLFVFTCLGYTQTVTIGTQVWMTKNLNVDKFRNGDPIPHAKTDDEWYNAGENKQPAWCYYNNDPANGIKYGKLYNWYAVNDPRGLAPKGWHVPNDAEWTALTDYSLGGLDVAGLKMKSIMGWERGGNGNNVSGFSGLPGGHRYDSGAFFSIGTIGFWWTFSKLYVSGACYRSLYDSFNAVGRYNFSDIPGEGMSVRCIRD